MQPLSYVTAKKCLAKGHRIVEVPLVLSTIKFIDTCVCMILCWDAVRAVCLGHSQYHTHSCACSIFSKMAITYQVIHSLNLSKWLHLTHDGILWRISGCCMWWTCFFTTIEVITTPMVALQCANQCVKFQNLSETLFFKWVQMVTSDS